MSDKNHFVLQSMKNIKEIQKNINSACNVVNLQSNRTENIPANIRDGDLIIDLRSDVGSSCDNEISECDIRKTCLPVEYNFEQDIEILIEVSKQFQSDYENDKVKNVSDVVSDHPDDCLNIPILNSNSLRQQKPKASEVNSPPPAGDNDNFYFSTCSSRKENIYSLSTNQRKKVFTPKLPHSSGPFGTGINRPSPKKHSCVQKSEIPSTKRSYRAGWNVRPYTARYYNFDRTHPDLQLVATGDSIIPKRVSKGPTKMIDKSRQDKTTKPLFNKGLTWHEFFERSNVYSAKSFQSSYGDVPPTHTITTQTATSEISTPKSNEVNKMQKHILPQLNIRAECCVQRIPEISIPCGPKLIVNSNIKLVEIIYEDSESKVQTIEGMEQSVDTLKGKQAGTEPQHFHNNLECTSSLDLESIEVNDSGQVKESSKTTLATSSKTSSENNGYNSSLEESVSLNVSRVSAHTSADLDIEAKKRHFKDVSIQTRKVKRIARHRRGVEERRILTSSSNYSLFDSEGKYLMGAVSLHLPLKLCRFPLSAKYLPQPEQQMSDELKLPTFPTNELIQMVDEIFDTSSDAVNMSYKYIVKETSVQTDIVWENINDLFKRQNVTLESDPRMIEVMNPNAISVGVQQSNVVSESEKIADRDSLNILPPTRPSATDEGVCHHTQLKKFEICSCLSCKSNIRFSAVNVNQSSQQISSNGSSSSSSADSGPSKPAAKMRLLPSERYKLMKQVQREHFENDPRISKTLKKIYATAKTMESRKETTSSSSSSNHYYQLNLPISQCKFSSCDDEVLQPDLFTFNDEVLLFGLGSSDDIHHPYPSYLLRTDSSSQDLSASSHDYKVGTSTKVMFMQDNLFCTNSEDSSYNSVVKPIRSDLELCLLKDIENSGSDPSSDVLISSSVFSTSSLERKVNEFHL